MFKSLICFQVWYLFSFLNACLNYPCNLFTLASFVFIVLCTYLNCGHNKSVSLNALSLSRMLWGLHTKYFHSSNESKLQMYKILSIEIELS